MKNVIIGHGPSIKNAKLGAFIDSTDGYIIRLSNRSWQDSLNYGTRTDYVCTPIEATRMERIFTESKAKYETWIYSRWRFKFRESGTKKRIARLQNDGFNPINCIGETFLWKKRYQELCRIHKKQMNSKGERIKYYGGRFSKGTAAIIIAAQRLNHVKELLLLGLDNLILGTNDNFFSYARFAFTNGKSFRNPREHDYVVEKQILDEVISKYKIKLLTI